MLGHKFYYILIRGLFFNRNSFVSYSHVKPFNIFTKVQTIENYINSKAKKQTKIADFFKRN